VPLHMTSISSTIITINFKIAEDFTLVLISYSFIQH
jgi:hypothetical protein